MNLRQIALAGVALVALSAGFAAPAQSQGIPRVLDERPPAVGPYADPGLRGGAGLRTTLSTPAPWPGPEVAAAAPLQPLIRAAAPPARTKTTPIVKRRTGKVAAPAVKTVRARPAPSSVIAQAEARALLGKGAPPLRQSQAPIVYNRNDGPGRVLPNANPLAPGATFDPATGEVIAATIPTSRPVHVVTVADARNRLDDPSFSPVGLRMGPLGVRPYGEINLGYDSNPDRVSTPVRGTMFETIGLGVDAQTDWTRHGVTAALRGGYTDFRADTRQNRHELAASLRGRIDVTQDFRAELEGHYMLGARVPDQSIVPAMERVALAHQLGAGVALERDFDRLKLTLRGNVDRFTGESTPLIGGGTAGDKPRDYTALGTHLRAQYDMNGWLKPFADIGYERRLYDGAAHGDIATGVVGAGFAASDMVVGEASAGVFSWTEAGRAPLRGAIVDASLAWMPTALTTVTARAGTTMGETGVVGANGVVRHDVSLQVDHAFRRYLLAYARVGLGYDEYLGLNRRDTRFQVAGGLAYKLSRVMQLRGELRHERLTSTVAGNDYTANIAMIGLRVQR